MKTVLFTAMLLLASLSCSASVQCLKGISKQRCKTDGHRLLDALTPMHAETLMPKEWVYTIVSNRDWKTLKESLGAPTEYAVSAPWLNRTFFKQDTIEQLDDDALAFVAAHEMAHIVCSLPMDKEKKANEVAHRMNLSHSSDVAKLCH